MNSDTSRQTNLNGPHRPASSWLLAGLVLACWAVAQDSRAGADASTEFARHPDYAKATAHDPHFQSAALWAQYDVERSAYAKENWQPARLLVWAHPGVMDRSLDPTDPANWLENGKPATRLFDAQTDLLFPDSETTYFVGTKGGPFACRHLTVGRNARVSIMPLTAYGNVWIKREGSIIWLEGLSGSRHTFARNDNRQGREIRISNKLTISKSQGASAEILGCFDTGDDLNLHSGTMIVGPESTFMPGDRSIQGIYPAATLVLLSGARFHKRGNQQWNNDVVVMGRLLAGTPERPLTKDCFLGLSYKSKGRVPEELAHGKSGRPDDYSLVVAPEGTIRVCSANPATARLVIGYHGCHVRVGWGPDAYTQPEPPEWQAIPHKIDMVLLGDLEFNGVVLEDVLKGGILVPDPAVRSQWQNVFYGENNDAPPDGLFERYEGPTEFKLKG